MPEDKTIEVWVQVSIDIIPLKTGLRDARYVSAAEEGGEVSL